MGTLQILFLPKSHALLSLCQKTGDVANNDIKPNWQLRAGKRGGLDSIGGGNILFQNKPDWQLRAGKRGCLDSIGGGNLLC